MSRLAELVERYENTAFGNETVYAELGILTDTTPLLKTHRDWVETNQWGFGDRPFHAMWHLLIEELTAGGQPLSFLEIGVYKGQVCSLWLAVAQEVHADLEVTGVTPLRGSGVLASRIGRRLFRYLTRVSTHFKKGLPDVYSNEDYESAIWGICETFGCDTSRLHLIRGYSTDAAVKQQLLSRSFDLVYIDGGHRYETVKHDISFYGGLLRSRGYLVLDDASQSLPGKTFWKGHPGPSQAADEIAEPEFRNVLNVGHNRVYQKT